MSFVVFFRLPFGTAIKEGLAGCSAAHVSALVCPLVVIVAQVGIKVRLHFIQRLIPVFSPLNSEMLIEQCSVQSFHKAVALRTSDAGCPVLDIFQLQE